MEQQLTEPLILDRIKFNESSRTSHLTKSYEADIREALDWLGKNGRVVVLIALMGPRHQQFASRVAAVRRQMAPILAS